MVHATKQSVTQRPKEKQKGIITHSSNEMIVFCL